MGDEETKRIILARRARFVAAALASVAAAAGVEACGSGGPDQPTTDAGTGRDGAEPQPCLSATAPDSGIDAQPQPCLEPLPPDAGDAGNDAEPQPCLAPPPGNDGG